MKENVEGEPAMADPVAILGLARTPIGSFQGSLSALSAPDLGAAAIRAAVSRSGVNAADIDQAIMGCVLAAGLGQAPARQAALGADLPRSVACTTVNKMCGSGMQALITAGDSLAAASTRFVVAGGMESMTNAPYLLPKARGGQRLGHGEVKDHMFLDGLEDAYEPGRLMGSFADATAAACGFSRTQQDEFALKSLKRAKTACEDGSFASELCELRVASRKEERTVVADETPYSVKAERIPMLKPAFSADGTVTAANSSSISDGAAAFVLARRSEAEMAGLAPLAFIRGHAVHAQAPSEFATAPVGAIRKLLEKTGWSVSGTDLFEINEAFAVVTMAAMREFALPAAKVNVHGGACALGHPIGASGARIVATLVCALRKYGLRRGVAALCIGGGEATALAVEIADEV